MSEDALSKAERYREAANRYSELAKEAGPGYVGEVYHKIAVQYLFMAADLLKWTDRPRGSGWIGTGQRLDDKHLTAVVDP
jgi:hypothetical protein